jgi:hypothetical protein
MNNKFWYGLILVWLLTLINTSSVMAQNEEPDFRISLQRNMGYGGFSGDIQGTFTIKAEDMEGLENVIFLLDGEPMAQVNEAPFKFQFHTDNYALGWHTFTAVGTSVDGKVLHSNEIRSEFVTPQKGWKTAGMIAGPVIGVALLVALFSFFVPLITRKDERVPIGARRSYGLLGGTICTKCGRPFSRHIFGLNMAVGRLDRCPYCTKWSIVRRASPQELAAAEAAELNGAGDSDDMGTSEPDQLRKDLEDSRFVDG